MIDHQVFCCCQENLLSLFLLSLRVEMIGWMYIHRIKSNEVYLCGKNSGMEISEFHFSPEWDMCNNVGYRGFICRNFRILADIYSSVFCIFDNLMSS